MIGRGVSVVDRGVAFYLVVADSPNQDKGAATLRLKLDRARIRSLRVRFASDHFVFAGKIVGWRNIAIGTGPEAADRCDNQKSESNCTSSFSLQLFNDSTLNPEGFPGSILLAFVFFRLHPVFDSPDVDHAGDQIKEKQTDSETGGSKSCY